MQPLYMRKGRRKTEGEKKRFQMELELKVQGYAFYNVTFTSNWTTARFSSRGGNIVTYKVKRALLSRRLVVYNERVRRIGVLEIHWTKRVRPEELTKLLII